MQQKDAVYLQYCQRVGVGAVARMNDLFRNRIRQVRAFIRHDAVAAARRVRRLRVADDGVVRQIGAYGDVIDNPKHGIAGRQPGNACWNSG